MGSVVNFENGDEGSKLMAVDAPTTTSGAGSPMAREMARIVPVRMPGMAGIDLLRRLRADYPDIEVIMMTGVNDVTTAVENMKLGAYDYVLKPFVLDEMLVRVLKAADRRRLSMQVRDYKNNL